MNRVLRPRARPAPSALCRSAVLLACGLLAAAGCAPARRHLRPEPSGSPEVRVALAERVSDLVLRADGPVRVHCETARDWEAPAGAMLRFVVLERSVVLTAPDGTEYRDPARIALVPADASAHLVLADTPYRGRMEVWFDAGALTLVNRLDVEEYLEGVVPYEIGWNGAETRAAVEAQAVAARTYTCARLGQYGGANFDLYADVRDQVYGGARRPDTLSDQAIAATRGLVLEQDGRLIQAYYCSTCGGFTAWIEHAWSKPPQPYLQGRRDAAAEADGAFCARSRQFRWVEAWSGADLEKTLQRTLPAVLKLEPDSAAGGLLDVRVAERDESDRVLDLEVRTTKGTYHVRGDSIRWVLKPCDRALLRSTMFKLDVRRDQGAIVEVVARGGGNGHGVGMCQSGALEMARRGYDRSAILAHYYPDTKLHRVY